MDIPAFHPEWLVTFWLTTPGLNKLNPHLLLVIIVIFVIGYYFIKRRKKPIEKSDSNEEQFQLLLTKKNMLEKELNELRSKYEQEELENAGLANKKKELEKHLEQTMRQLQQFI
ncbi:hypothetical protein [Robertmurraya andreesenii]|uniref:Uncharacterized protein HemX n=1 Tax=Anoxybacillus andreesenii TaxID=1325932 RepID=A0ABT9UZH8_9BACL|nr:hypothetical protein [Robertmurraya andreesenii]MDQ0154106.1 uncharacterized protein HemX [Robertmurraya andreesenii]